MPDTDRAAVYEVDGKLMLHDPVAVGVTQAMGKHNCRNTLDLNADGIVHFKQRFLDLQLSPTNVVIVVINVDDVHGGLLSEALAPGTNWQEYRDRGEIPFARGLAGRPSFEEALGYFDHDAAMKLHEMTDLAIVVVDHGVAEVFPA